MINSKAIKYGDHVNTDVIIPARYLNTIDPAELAKHCMEDLDNDFARKVGGGARIVVAGRNFGCGSSREHAPVALKAAGIQCVIADSFARIFYRNSLNIGLPIVECPAAVEIQEGDVLAIDLASGVIRNETTRREYRAEPFPEFMRRLIDAGGLMGFIGEFTEINFHGEHTGDFRSSNDLRTEVYILCAQ